MTSKLIYVYLFNIESYLGSSGGVLLMVQPPTDDRHQSFLTEIVRWLIHNVWGAETSHKILLAILTHPPLVLQICVSEWSQHRFRWWLVTYLVPSHYLNQYCVIVNWTLRNKLQWIKIQNFSFIKMRWKMSSVKWQLFCPGLTLQVPVLYMLDPNSSHTEPADVLAPTGAMPSAGSVLTK